MKMKRWLLAGGMAAAMAAAVAAGPARAANPVPINRFTDWLAQTYDDSGKTLCYATSAPKKQAGNFAGYDLKPNSEVILTIGDQNFSLSVLQKDRAWAKDATVDKAMIDAMRKGSSLTVKGTSSRGTEITDTYSLLGFSKAYQAIGAACKVQ